MTTTPNRHQRRRDKAGWRRRMQAMAKEAAGVWQIELIRPERDEPRPETGIPVLEWCRQLARADQPAPLCLCCEREFALGGGHIPTAFMFLRPYRDDPAIVSVTGICREHAALDDAALVDVAVEFVRRSFLPDARRLDPAHMPGAAGRA